MIRILVPLDGSQAAEESISHALSIARAFPAEVQFLRVVDELGSDAEVRTDNIDLALWHHQAQAYLDDLIEKFSTDNQGSIEGLVLDGNAPDVIIRHMKETEPDLLVLSRYGRGNAQEFAAGGTAQKILSGANCSVLLLDPGKSIDTDNIYHRILVSVDDDKNSDCAVAVATMIANTHGASLVLVYIIDEPNLPKGLPQTRHAQELLDGLHRIIRTEAQRRLNEISAKIPENIPVETQVLVSSDMSFAIESTAETCNSDLMVSHIVDSETDHNRRYGSVNQSLIQYSHRPLFILQARTVEGLASNFRSVYLDEPCIEVI